MADKGAALGHSISEFLTKPASGEDLCSALERVGLSHEHALVLVVDDDEAARRFARISLEKQGFRVVTASDGEEGLSAARRHAPAAIVLDLMMPKLDGFGFLNRLRRFPEGAQTPVIVWSSRETTPDERAQLQAQAQAVVLKGADASTALLEAVGLQLRRPR